MKYSTGALRNPLRQLKSYSSLNAADLPDSIITDISMLPVLNQGQQPACVGHATANAVNYDYYKKTGKIPNSSPKWNYDVAKVVDGNQNEGTCALSVFNGWKIYGGSATINTVPNTVDEVVADYSMLQITPTMLSDAKLYPIINEVEVSNPSSLQLMSLIQQYGVVTIAVDVDETTWMDQDGSGNLLPGDAGGHEILLYGYKKMNAVDVQFHILNSWDITWGVNGCGTFLWSDYNGHVYDAMSIQVDMNTTPIGFTKDKFMSFYSGTQYEANAEACYDAVAISLAQASILSDMTLIGALATIRTEVGKAYLPVRENITQEEANANYNGRMGNVIGTNDGFNFRGGGYIQLTGRYNYTKIGTEIGVDLADNPDLIDQVSISAKSLVQYFVDNKVDAACNEKDWTTVRELVNGGITGLNVFLSIVDQFLGIM